MDENKLVQMCKNKKIDGLGPQGKPPETVLNHHPLIRNANPSL